MLLLIRFDQRLAVLFRVFRRACMSCSGAVSGGGETWEVWDGVGLGAVVRK